MYNQYLSQFPIDITPEEVEEPAEVPTPSASSPSGGGLFSLLSNALNHQTNLLSAENIITLAALAFLLFDGNEFDSELLILAVLFLVIGL